MPTCFVNLFHLLYSNLFLCVTFERKNYTNEKAITHTVFVYFLTGGIFLNRTKIFMFWHEVLNHLNKEFVLVGVELLHEIGVPCILCRLEVF